MKYEINTILLPFVFLVDLVGSILFFWNKLRKRPKEIKKVLFIRLEHIGDMIMAMPVFETFKKNHPECEVHVLCRALTAPLLRNNPNVDKVTIYDAPWFIKRENEQRKKFSELISELKIERYDVVFEMHGDPRNNYLAFRTGAYVVGYSCRGLGFLVNNVVAYDTNTHMIEQNLKLIEPFCTELIKRPRLYADKIALKNAEQLLKKYKLDAKKYILLNPRSGRIEKDLTDEECIAFINKYKSSKIVIVGSKAEISRNNVFSQFNNVIDLTGKTDLLTFIELVRKAKKVIGPDTSIIHIAYAAGTPFEAVYKTTDRKRWGY